MDDLTAALDGGHGRLLTRGKIASEDDEQDDHADTDEAENLLDIVIHVVSYAATRLPSDESGVHSTVNSMVPSVMFAVATVKMMSASTTIF